VLVVAEEHVEHLGRVLGSRAERVDERDDI
jgi:hypothetical protein